MCTRLLLLVSLSALLNFSAYAEVYKTTDKDGRVVYTDQPAASDTKAKVVELPSINQLPPTQYTHIRDNAPPAEKPPHYQLTIVSPATGTRLMANERNLSITLESDNYLVEGLFFTYFLNGEKIAQTTSATFTLNEPPRGENKIHVTVENRYGKVFGQSDAITVYVVRPISKR